MAGKALKRFYDFFPILEESPGATIQIKHN
nr:MAG TPA: protein of unknown function (DUF4752) [Caudoviricetes sp.]